MLNSRILVKRWSCYFDKALVNVGADLAKLVPGRVSTEVDARLAYDTHAIIHKLYGFAYGGPFGHFLHKLMDAIFNGKKGKTTVAKKCI
ncbi:hypothetical protein J5N97_027787 [Dioscorea zingiberensis]|uniref:Uncharacterized protein n=1 Tax=Dioscorea zingiberensis TaxID=325984 RepID=A0A9D5BXY8_9LILI|nr:hypothetical protein J5N97_027787 [Dioscorea zingiberensis]